MSRVLTVRHKTRRILALPIMTKVERFKSSVKALVLLSISLVCLSCGTTKFSDTSRTATEQLLISSAMEDLVDEYDYSRLSGLKVFVKEGNSATDSDYLKSLIRQQLASNGAFVKDTQEEADYIVEMAPGTVGTNRYELMYGIPETTIPALGTLTSATSIPEFALIKRTDQKAQIKLRMWAYNKTTGAIIWQSGVDTKSSQLRDRWLFGAGPFTTATYDNAGIRLGADKTPLSAKAGETSSNQLSVRSEASYRELDEKAIERLQKLREEGLKAYEEETEEGEKLETVEDAATEGETENTVAENASDSNSPKSDDAAAESVASTTETPTPTAIVPETTGNTTQIVQASLLTPQVPKTTVENDDNELDLGFKNKVLLGTASVPEPPVRQ